MKTKPLFFIALFLVLTSCISTRSTIKNIDDNAPGPTLNQASNSFVITQKATDKKYAYHEDYPVNVGFTSLNEGAVNQIRFLNALAGPNGEKVTYVKKDACCPFPTKKTEMGAGTIDMFEVTWEGNTKPVILYINKFERGALLIPVGFTAKK